MRLSLRAHSIMDYGLAAFFLGAPWLFGFAQLPHEMGISVACGRGIASLSSITDYKMGLLRFVPFPIHRGADVVVESFSGARRSTFRRADCQERSLSPLDS